MDFIAYPSLFSSSSPSSFGNFIERVREACHFAVSAIIGNIFSAIFTFFFALGIACVDKEVGDDTNVFHVKDEHGDKLTDQKVINYIKQSYKELTGTAWSLTYFVSFYLITVLLLLNLIVAFVLEAFFAEMDLESLENFEEHDKEPFFFGKNGHGNLCSRIIT